MTKISHRKITANGINIHIAEAGRGPLLVLLHGFPDLWYTWRHQLLVLAAAGYHVVAPDLRGYGETDAPTDIPDYSMVHMVGDVIGLLDALGEDKAIVAGHDWGARIAWHTAQLHKERVSAIIALSVAFDPRLPTTELMKQWSGDHFNFALYFQEPGAAEAELERDPRRSLRLFLYALSGDAPAGVVSALFKTKPASAGVLDGMPEPDPLPPWLAEADLDYYARSFARTGFRGALNRYRNMDRDAAELTALSTSPIVQPALFLAGERDSAFSFATMDPMKAIVTNLRGAIILPGCGHWLQQERAAEIETEILLFLHNEHLRNAPDRPIPPIASENPR